jgi:hypothetical protein
MSATPMVIPGVVRGGVVVFDRPTKLPEGTKVQVTVPLLEFTPEERAEFEAWEKLSDEAWSQIDWGEGEIARDSG